MRIIEMSVHAAILIAVIIIVRALVIHRLPKRAFMILWGVALLRLLIPFYMPVTLTLGTPEELTEITVAARPIVAAPALEHLPAAEAPPATHAPPPEAAPEAYVPEPADPFLMIALIWLAGALGLALFFIAGHVRWRGEYKAALPVTNAFALEWLRSQKLKRAVQIRQSDKINAPLTYGIIKPVILLPRITDWQNEAQLGYVLAHEMTHIRRFDVLKKWILAAALCIHWFNPLVWAMYILAGRDVEIACDEAVVQTFGSTRKSRADYAMILIEMEENKAGFSALANNFAKIAIEERIKAIMKMKRKSFVSIILAAVLAASAMIVFAAPNIADLEPVMGKKSCKGQKSVV